MRIEYLLKTNFITIQYRLWAGLPNELFEKNVETYLIL